MSIIEKYSKIFDACKRELKESHVLDADVCLDRVMQTDNNYCGYFKVLYDIGEINYSQYVELYSYIGVINSIVISELLVSDDFGYKDRRIVKK